MADQVTSRVNLSDDGVLWMINATIFHPRGLALSRDLSGNLFLIGDGEEVWTFNGDLSQEKKDAFENLIELHLSRFGSSSERV